MSKKKLKFNIGDIVLISAEIDPSYVEERNNKPIKVYRRYSYPYPKEGQIVGAARRFFGEIISPSGSIGSGYDPYDYEYCPGYLDIKDSKFLWLVRLGLLNKPLFCLEEDLKLKDKVYPHSIRAIPKWGKQYELPLLYSEQPPFPDELRKLLSEEAKQAPRDKKGRFTK
jgi:hypothetical protein